ncbi:MAG: hypothetical protein K2O78_07730 [Muribaculaceae bacterium]|nr:hypothetical protein [Muribaculaceae bacterium]
METVSSKFLDLNGLRNVLAKVNKSIEDAHADATLPATPTRPGLVIPADGIDVDETGTISVRIVSDDEIAEIWTEVLFTAADRDTAAAG